MTRILILMASHISLSQHLK